MTTFAIGQNVKMHNYGVTIIAFRKTPQGLAAVVKANEIIKDDISGDVFLTIGECLVVSVKNLKA